MAEEPPRGSYAIKYVCMCVCMHVCVYVCMYVINEWMDARTRKMSFTRENEIV